MTHTSKILPTKLSAEQLSVEWIVNSNNDDIPIPTAGNIKSTSENTAAKLKSDIPDGKWGWVVVFASLIICMLVDGMNCSFGMLYIELLHEFNASSSVTSWIGSIFVAVPFLYGPIMSALVDKYGCRNTTFFAGIISAVGLVISSKVSSLGIMYLTFGALSGIGRGICCITNSVSVTFWFDKKRTLAIGLSSAGAGIGTFLFPPLTNFLLSEYGWRGTTLVLGGLFLNTCVCGALMRDPDYITEGNRLAESNKTGKINAVMIRSKDVFTASLNRISCIKADTAHEPLLKDNCNTYGSQSLHRIPSNNKENFNKNTCVIVSSCSNVNRISTSPLYRDDVEKWYTELLDLLKKMLDFSLLLELHFFVLCLATVVLYTWLIVPFFYIADHMTKYGYTNEAASLSLSNIGITNTIGMIALGWAGTQPWMNLTKTYAFCVIMGGISCAGIMYFTTNFVMLEISLSSYGLFLGSTYSYTPGIIVQLIPLEKFTIACGLVMFCTGMGLLVGPPYAGHLYDVTKSWQQTFYQAAMWIIISGTLIAIIPNTRNRKIFGKGSVLQEIKGQKDNFVFLSAFILAILALLSTVLYFSIDCLL